MHSTAITTTTTPDPRMVVNEGGTSPLASRSGPMAESHTVHAIILTSGDVTLDAAREGFEPGLARTRSVKGIVKNQSSLSVFQNLVVDEDDKRQYANMHLPDRYEGGSVRSVLSWFGRMCLAGVGMFVEAFIVITTGQIKTIWHGQYPECWIPDDDQNCPNQIDCCCLFPNTLLDLAPDPAGGVCAADGQYPDSMLCTERNIHAVSYAEFAGIMGGMLVIGFTCDWIGRKNAGVITSLLMLAGITIMAFIKHENINTQFAIWSTFFAVFGFGVGGEYPLTASGAAEKQFEWVDMAKLDSFERRKKRIQLDHAMSVRRGENISLVFAMQGLGALAGSVVLIALIYFGNQGTVGCDNPASNATGNNPDALNGIWRSFYFIGWLMILLLVAYRFLIVEESTVSAVPL
jgi:hypothetical protein